VGGDDTEQAVVVRHDYRVAGRGQHHLDHGGPDAPRRHHRSGRRQTSPTVSRIVHRGRSRSCMISWCGMSISASRPTQRQCRRI
jgi:hypothetical protein